MLGAMVEAPRVNPLRVGSWLGGPALASVLVGAVAWRWPRLGSSLTGIVLVPVTLTWLLIGTGH
jgi:hypothetical protein